MGLGFAHSVDGKVHKEVCSCLFYMIFTLTLEGILTGACELQTEQ